jgi:hypothetical protein
VGLPPWASSKELDHSKNRVPSAPKSWPNRREGLRLAEKSWTLSETRRIQLHGAGEGPCGHNPLDS